MENSAKAAFPLFGKNKKNEADQLAVDAMRFSLSSLEFAVRIVLGEGEKDDAPMLYEGEILGKGEVLYDLAVDPLECTSNFAKGLYNSLSVLAFSEKDGIRPVPGTYMEQWIAGPKMKSAFKPYSPLTENINALAENLGKSNDELRVVVQDRPRHDKLIKELRELGCSVCLIDSGSVTAVLDICLEKGMYDALIGTFGAPEGLISAVIAKITHSEMKGILRPHDEAFRKRAEDHGFKDEKVLDKNDWVPGEKIGFLASCLSPNHFMRGLKVDHHIVSGETLVLYENHSSVEGF